MSLRSLLLENWCESTLAYVRLLSRPSGIFAKTSCPSPISSSCLQVRTHATSSTYYHPVFGLLRNVEGRSNGRAGTAFLGQVAAGEGEGDEGFVGRESGEGT